MNVPDAEYRRLVRVELAARAVVRAFNVWHYPPWKRLTVLCVALGVKKPKK